MKKILRVSLIVVMLSFLTGCSDELGEGTTYVDEANSQTMQVSENNDEDVDTLAGLSQEVELDGEIHSIESIEKTMYVKTTATVRSGPSKTTDNLDSLSSDTEVQITGEVDNGWYRVDYQGNEAYIFGELLSETKAEVKKDNTEVVNSATQEDKTDDSTANATSKSETTSTSTSASSTSADSSTTVTVPTQAETQGNLVWVPTNGGTKYHTYSSCSNMKDPIQVSLETAVANGYTACKRCH